MVWVFSDVSLVSNDYLALFLQACFANERKKICANGDFSTFKVRERGKGYFMEY
jgi:hypothetical protein